MRLIGVTIPDEKTIETSLTYIYGIGRNSAQKILKETGISPILRTKQLSPEDTNKLKGVIEKNFKTEGELRRAVQKDIARLIDTGTYRGARHSRKLPTRGQRTKTNSRTIRGNVRKTAGSGRRKLELK